MSGENEEPLVGQFRQKPKKGWLFQVLAPGVLLAYALLNHLQGDAPGRVALGLAAGLSLAGLGILIRSWNRGAFLRLEQGRLLGRYGWGRRLDCRAEAVAFVETGFQTLTLLMEDGRRHDISGLENPESFHNALLLDLFGRQQPDVRELSQRFHRLRRSRKGQFWGMVWCLFGLFVTLILGVLGTGGRNMAAFTPRDRWIFGITMTGLLGFSVAALALAHGCGRKKLPLHSLSYRMRGALVLHQPLPPGNPLWAGTTAAYGGRVILYGFPNDKSVYYCVQQCKWNREGTLILELTHRSKIYPGEDALPEGLLDHLLALPEVLWKNTTLH